MTIHTLQLKETVPDFRANRDWIAGDKIQLEDLERADKHHDSRDSALTGNSSTGAGGVDSDELRKQAYEEGFRIGQEAGRKALEEEVEQLRETVSSLSSVFPEALNELENPLLDIAKRLAAIVLGVSAFDSDLFHKAMLEKLREMIGRLAGQKRFVLELNPDTLLLIDKHKLFASLSETAIPEVVMLPDKRLKPGECIIKTEDFLIDGTFGNQTDFLVEQLITEEAV
ncbi:MAG: FliH/SctL family protein [Calditrichia bacterium]